MAALLAVGRRIAATLAYFTFLVAVLGLVAAGLAAWEPVALWVVAGALAVVGVYLWRAWTRLGPGKSSRDKHLAVATVRTWSAFLLLPPTFLVVANAYPSTDMVMLLIWAAALWLASGGLLFIISALLFKSWAHLSQLNRVDTPAFMGCLVAAVWAFTALGAYFNIPRTAVFLASRSALENELRSATFKLGTLTDVGRTIGLAPVANIYADSSGGHLVITGYVTTPMAMDTWYVGYVRVPSREGPRAQCDSEWQKDLGHGWLAVSAPVGQGYRLDSFNCP